VNGALDVDTGDGSITVDGKLTSLRARSGDGSGDEFARRGEAPPKPTGKSHHRRTVPWCSRCRTGFNGELDAHTGRRPRLMHDITLNNVTGQIGKNSVRGRLGSGGPRRARPHRRRIDYAAAILKNRDRDSGSGIWDLRIPESRIPNPY